MDNQSLFIRCPIKEWVALSDAEKLNSTVDFYPGGSTGEKLPLPSSKISGLAKMVPRPQHQSRYSHTNSRPTATNTPHSYRSTN